MCGIGGILRMTDKPIEETQIRSLLIGLEHRGREASGVLMVDEDWGEFHICKDGLTATRFVETMDYTKFMCDKLTPKTKAVLVHCRQHTIGTPRDNKNNHPLYLDKCAIIHNGHVSNHTQQFEQRSLHRNADVDSDIIRAICDSEGLTHKGVRELSKLSGSIAAAAVDKRQPGALLLMRSSNPLFIGTSEDNIIFASTKQTVSAAAKTWVKRWGLWSSIAPKGIDYAIFPADSAWLFTPDGDAGKPGRAWHQKFQTAAYTSDPDWYRSRSMGFYNGGYESYYEREDDGTVAEAIIPYSVCETTRGINSFKDSKLSKEYYICPNHKCGCRCTLDKPELKKLPPSKLFCTKCGTNLNGATHVWAAN